MTAPDGPHGLARGLTNYGDANFARYLRRSFATSMGHSKAILFSLPTLSEDDIMRIVVHGQQAFGESVLDALLERGEYVVCVYCAPEPSQGGRRVEPLNEATSARAI